MAAWEETRRTEQGENFSGGVFILVLFLLPKQVFERFFFHEAVTVKINLADALCRLHPKRQQLHCMLC